MNERVCTLFGIVGPVVGYICIGVSIALSPWFSWQTSALSDLGHAVKSDAASIFNFGLLFAGLFIAVYAVTAFRKHAKYTSIFLLLSAFTLQLVAVFDEVYGVLHMVVSVLFFVLLIISSIVYAVERRSYVALTVFFIGLLSWATYGLQLYNAGVAVPETISSVVVVFLIIYSAIKIYRGRVN